MKEKESENMASMTVPNNQAFVVGKEKVEEFKKQTVSKEHMNSIIEQAKKFKKQRRNKLNNDV